MRGSPSDRRNWFLAVSGLFYIALQLVSSWASGPGLSATGRFLLAADYVTGAYLLDRAWALVAVLIVLLTVYRLDLASFLRLKRPGIGLVLPTVVGLVLFLALNALNVWPYFWRWHADATLSYAQLVLTHHAWTALLIQICISGLLVPLVEELVFRGAFLRLVWNRTRSPATAVTVSSALFACAHLGNSSATIYNAGWLFVFGLVLGSLAVRSPRSIVVPWVVHGTRNTLEIATLFIAASWA